jgi:uncharacterized coiled-coil protein SlyX
MPSVVRFMLQAFLEIDASEEPASGQADTIRGLNAKVRELEAELASMRRRGERGR